MCVTEVEKKINDSQEPVNGDGKDADAELARKQKEAKREADEAADKTVSEMHKGDETGENGPPSVNPSHVADRALGRESAEAK